METSSLYLNYFVDYILTRQYSLRTILDSLKAALRKFTLSHFYAITIYSSLLLAYEKLSDLIESLNKPDSVN